MIGDPRQGPDGGRQIPLDGGEEHQLWVRVFYEDTDFSGVVYHARYLHFFERGRTEFLRSLGFDQARLRAREDSVVFAVHDMSIRFLAAARMDDALLTRTRLTDVGGARLVMRQAMECEGKTIVRADVTIAVLSKTGRPRRLPDDMRAGLTPSLADWSKM